MGMRQKGVDDMRKSLLKLIVASIAVGAITFTPKVYHLPMVSVAHAEVQTYQGIGEEYSSTYELQSVAKQRALAKAIKAAQDQAVVYLINYSKTLNAYLEANEIQAITLNACKTVGEPKYERLVQQQVTNVSKVIAWRVTVNVEIDDSELKTWINRDTKDKSKIMHQAEQLRRMAAENDNKIEDLRKQAQNTNVNNVELKKQFEQINVEFLANQKLEEGNKLFYVKDFQGAITKYNDTLKLKPNLDWAYNNRGNVYSQLGNYKQAITDYNKAIEIDPQNDIAYYNCGLVYRKLGEIQRAITNYTKAIEINPQNAEAYNNIGLAYSSLGDKQLAIENYTKAIELNPNYYEAYTNRGVAYSNLGDTNQAIEDTTKAIEINPNYITAYKLRGLCYKKLGDNDKAQADYAKAKQLSIKVK